MTATPPPPPSPEPQADSRAPWIIGLLALLAVLLIVLIIVILNRDDGPEAATTTTTTAATTTTTAPATTTAPPTTAAPTTTVTTTPPTTEAPTTTEVTVSSFTLVPDGLEGPVVLFAGMSPEDATASGYIDYPGPEFTEEEHGYTCGFGEGAGVLTGTFDAMFLEDGLSRFYITSAALRTADGLGMASDQAEVEAVLGPPTETQPETFGSGQDHFYQFGEHGILFTIRDGAVEHVSVGFYDALFFVEGCL